MNQEESKNRIQVVTLGELGQVMPLGIMTNDGNYSKSFEIKRWRMKEERELGEKRDANRDSNMAQLVSTVLSMMCTGIGQHDFTNMKDAEKTVHISQMYVGDVYYIYVWLRRKSIGNKLNLVMKCSRCSHSFDFAADLDTVEVNKCETLGDALWDYELQDPFEIRGRLVTEFIMGPPRWITLENMRGAGSRNIGAAKASLISGSISSIKDWLDDKGQPLQIALTMNEIDEMGKADIEAITSKMDENAIGPNMSVECTCPRCRTEQKMAIDWSYDNFFDISGQ